MVRAKALLREGDASVEAVARDCGFNSRRQFAERFGKLVGASPRVFRTRGKASAPERRARSQ